MDNINNLIRKSTDIDVPGAAQLNLKDTDVVQIWDEVSAYIDRFMTNNKGVTIPGFGTFTFTQKKIDIGNNKIILVQRPIFSIAEKFAQTHGLQTTKYPVAGNIPVHPLNYSAVAQETAFTRDDVEQCVKHILQVMNRSVQSRKNVEFTFTTIGKMQIRDSKVKMKFFKDFIANFEESGKIIEDMQNRPGTCDSVISRNELPRTSRNTCLLPRLNSRVGANSALDNNIMSSNNNVMDTIQEDYGEIDEPLQIRPVYLQEENDQQQQQVPVASYYSPDESALSETHPQQYHELNTDRQEEADSPTQQLEPMPQQIYGDGRPSTTSSYRIPTLFSSKSMSALNQPHNPPLNQSEFENLKKALASKLTHNQPQRTDNVSPQAISPTAQVRASTGSGLVRPSSSRLISSLIPKAEPTKCGHYNAGQELCYLCHQRSRRNVPVYLHEEIKQKDAEETQLLMQYQSLKDLDKQLKDEEKRNNQRMDRAKIDAFNLGVSEAVRQKKAERPKTSDMSRSFVFRKRCRTPPKTNRQQELGDFLSKQIDIRNRENLLNKQESAHMEKMEQKQLAEDLAAQREAYLRTKYKKQADLKNALDTQLKNKAPYLPKVLPDGEVFGQYDMKNEKLARMKQKEMEQHNYNREAIEQRKRESLLNQLKEQEVEAENNNKLKEELRCDRANRFGRMVNMRKNLEQNWDKSHFEKTTRDQEERGHRYAHDGTLVHEQCDKYKRCGQCQKDVKNCGESNIWADTRYVAGTRLMA